MATTIRNAQRQQWFHCPEFDDGRIRRLLRKRMPELVEGKSLSRVDEHDAFVVLHYMRMRGDGSPEWLPRWKRLIDWLGAVNRPLILHFARLRSNSMDEYHELVIECHLPMTRAIIRFNPNYGTKFSTYAMRAMLMNWSRWVRKRQLARVENRTVEFSRLAQSGVEFNSLRCLAVEDDDSRHDIEDLRFRTERAMRSLTKLQATAVRLRFGIDDGIARKLSEISAIMGSNDAAVSMLVNGALKTPAFREAMMRPAV